MKWLVAGTLVLAGCGGAGADTVDCDQLAADLEDRVAEVGTEAAGDDAQVAAIVARLDAECWDVSRGRSPTDR